jgi:hypothetical protein
VIPEENVLEREMDEFEVLDSGELCQTHAASIKLVTVSDAQNTSSLPEKVLVPLSENPAPLSFNPEVVDPSFMATLQP